MVWVGVLASAPELSASTLVEVMTAMAGMPMPMTARDCPLLVLFSCLCFSAGPRRHRRSGAFRWLRTLGGGAFPLPQGIAGRYP